MYCDYILGIKGHDVCNFLSTNLMRKRKNNKAYGAKC